MSDNDHGRYQDSRTQIIVALVGLFGTLSVAVISNWDRLFPPRSSSLSSPSPSPTLNETAQSAWQFMGNASTGESIFVDTNSISRSADAVDFTYRIGAEVLAARADCNRNQWYVNNYRQWYSPSSQATQEMLTYVCR